MRSNKRRWAIAGIILALIGLFLGWVIHSVWIASPRTPFSLDRQNEALIELPVSPVTVLPTMAATTDAGTVYRRAIDAYLKDPFTYLRFARSGTRTQTIDDLPAIWILTEAADAARADLFASHPSDLVNLDSEKPRLEALQTVATCARRAGQLIETSRPADAKRLYEAVFALGDKLYTERLTYAELDAGLTMMAEGSALIGRLDPSRAQACRQFNEARKDYVKQRILPMERVIGSIDPATLEEHAGDVFYFAQSAPERTWRIEAIFALARYRFNAGKLADSRQANSLVQTLCADPDPVIRTAAEAARDLTVEQYRMLK